MVTNLPENVKAQWRRVIAAKDPETKLVELLKFYSMVPKHKGTKNLLKQVRRQISKLREEIEERKRRKYAQYIPAWEFPKHGVARIALLSNDYYLSASFFKFLTGIDVLEAMWRHKPIYGIYSDGTLQYQIVYLPPLYISDNLDYKIASFCKTCDMLFIILTSDVYIKEIYDRLKIYGLSLEKKPLELSIKRLSSGGIRIIGLRKYENVIKNILMRMGINHVVVSIEVNGDVSEDEIEDAITRQAVYVPNYYISHFNNEYIYIKNFSISNTDDNEIVLRKNELGIFILKELKLIRVYTRDRSGNVAKYPVILREGSKVYDLAKIIHTSLADNMRYAVVIRNRNEIKVSKDYELMDNDIVEIRT